MEKRNNTVSNQNEIENSPFGFVNGEREYDRISHVFQFYLVPFEMLLVGWHAKRTLFDLLSLRINNRSEHTIIYICIHL